MSNIRRFASKILPEEWLSISIFIVVTFINFFVYKHQVSFFEAVKMMINYFSFGDPFYGLFFVALYLVAIGDFYVSLAKVLINSLVDKTQITQRMLLNLVGKLFSPVRVMLPIGLVTGSAYELLTHFSFQLREKTFDVLLSRMDLSIFGKLLFIYLPTHFNSELTVKVLSSFYFSLSYCLPLFLILLILLKKKNLLRLAVTTFVFAFLFSFPIFYFFPAQGPSYSIIKNIRNNTLPADIKSELETYRPSEYTTSIENQIVVDYVDVKHDNSSPVSSIPSTHAIWAFIIIYYLWRIRRYTLFITIPWAVVMLTGGIYLGQHYLIDYLASIPIAMLCIYCAHRLLGFSEGDPDTLLKST